MGVGRIATRLTLLAVRPMFKTRGIAMNKFEITEDPEASDAEFIACMRLTRPLLLPDNVLTLCCRCGEAIQHRPHIPKRLKTVCLPCIQPDLERDAAKGELEVQITPESAKEISAYFRKKNAN